MKYFRIILLLLIASAGYGQKRQLTTSDYVLWNTISSGPVSKDGNWLTYLLKHQAADTLFIQNIRGTKNFSLPSASQVQFSEDSRFAAFRRGDSIHLMALKTGKSRQYAVQGQHLFTAGGYLILQNVPTEQLRIVNLKNYSESYLDNVAKLVVDPLGKSAILLRTAGGNERVERLTFGATLKIDIIVAQTSGKFQNFQWNSKGSHLVFLEKNGSQSEKHNLVFVALAGPAISIKKVVADSKGFPAGNHIADSPLYVSDDGKRVFFELSPPAQEIVPAASDVVIWQSNSKQLAPPEKRNGYGQKNRSAVWHPSDGKIIALETDTHPYAILSGNELHALVFSATDYLPQHRYGGEYADFHLIDLNTGIQQLILKQHLFSNGQTLLSPKGKYIAYFKEGNWWTYSIKTKKHNCLTGNLESSFVKASHDKTGTAPPYPFGGWSLDDSQMLLHDEFDLWIVALDGTSSRRITDGRSRSIRHRIYDDGLLYKSIGKAAGFSSKTIDLESTVTIATENQHSLRQGISLWNRKKGLRKLYEADRKIYSLQHLGKNEALTYFECSFDSPPALKILAEGRQHRTIAQSNTQQSDFYWGKSEVVHYEANGLKLKGALFYPSDYVPGRKYPMIVNIYEQLSRTVHDYVPPSGKSENGFSATDLTQQGFFVFCPDIAYTLDDAGNSALRCVTSAVEKVLESQPIDPSRMGIMGHSFGGYETSYIIAHSSLFKAAIAGAAVTDIKGFSLTVNNEGRPNLVLAEEQQLRLSQPFYGPEPQRNSPIESIMGVKTPVLIWTSDSDQVVPPSQSMAFHIALWRLGKESTLLVYPKEGHSLMKEENQEDLSRRVSEWFSHYLKGEKKPAWM